MPIETKNAIIKSVTLSSADHGCLSSFVHLEYGGSVGQGFGGYSLYAPKNPRMLHANYAGHFIWRVMEIAGVCEWANLPGRTIRVRAEWTKVHAIGHIVNDDWFDPSEDFKEMEARFDDKAR